MELLNMFLAFFRVGMFTIGGGLVAIPIMQEYAVRYGWIGEEAFIDMIAVSQSTPGPIGINLATYVGSVQYGLLGSVVVTLGMVLPSFLIISIVSRFLLHFNENRWVKSALVHIRPVVVGVILTAAFFIARVAVVDVGAYRASGDISDLADVRNIVLFLFFFLVMFKVKFHPVVFVAIGGTLGLLFF